MKIEAAKRLADKLGCELWYIREWRSWALNKKLAVSVESSGGMFISPGQLRDLDADQFHTFCVSALGTPDSKTDELMQIARYNLGVATRSSGVHHFTSCDYVRVQYHPDWVGGTEFEFFHNGVPVDEARVRELVG